MKIIHQAKHKTQMCNEWYLSPSRGLFPSRITCGQPSGFSSSARLGNGTSFPMSQQMKTMRTCYRLLSNGPKYRMLSLRQEESSASLYFLIIQPAHAICNFPSVLTWLTDLWMGSAWNVPILFEEKTCVFGLKIVFWNCKQFLGLGGVEERGVDRP